VIEVGRGDFYGDELGLQLVRVDARQLFYVLGQEVADVQVALVVSEELEEARGVIQVGKGLQVLYKLNEPGMRVLHVDAAGVQDGVGHAGEVSEEGGQDHVVVLGLGHYGEDPEDASDAQFEEERGKPATSHVGLGGERSDYGCDVAIDVREVRLGGCLALPQRFDVLVHETLQW